MQGAALFHSRVFAGRAASIHSLLIIIMGIYEYGVQRVNVLRFLFGLKPLQREKTLAQVALNAAKS